jgi:hypothetical protein
VIAQYSDTSSGGWAIFSLVSLAVYVFYIVAVWRAFEKAGKPGWAAIVPIYNFYIMCKIAGRPGWWWVLLLSPLVNIVIWFVVAIDVANAFGKSTGFGIGLALLPIIFWAILGFGDASYLGPRTTYAGTSMTPPPPPPPTPSS